MTTKLTREQILALEPSAAFANGLRDPASPDAPDLAPAVMRQAVPALVDQLREAGMVEPALGSLLTAFDRAVATLDDRTALTDADQEALRHDLDAATAGREVARQWMHALRAQVSDRLDLEAAITLLERARTLWMLKDQLSPPARAARSLS